MQQVPDRLDADAIRTALVRDWDLRITELRHVPVGAGSHNWRATDAAGREWFVKVDDLTKTRIGPDPESAWQSLSSALQTAAGLSREFVVAPVPDRTGTVLGRLDERYSLSVYPLLPAAALGHGGYPDRHDRRRVLRLIGSLHRTDPASVPRIRHDDLSIPGRDLLDALLQDGTACRGPGPFAGPTRSLLATHRTSIHIGLKRFDDLAAYARNRPGWVVTHGEPHSANVLQDTAGSLLLIDWDTVLLAPRERDLVDLLLDDDDLALYRATTGQHDVAPDPQVRRLYALWWDLAEIAEYVSRFSRPHEEDADTRAAWEDLQQYVPVRLP